MQMGLKVTNEAPVGIKAGLRASYQWVTQDSLDAVNRWKGAESVAWCWFAAAGCWWVLLQWRWWLIRAGQLRTHTLAPPVFKGLNRSLIRPLKRQISPPPASPLPLRPPALQV